MSDFPCDRHGMRSPACIRGGHGVLTKVPSRPNPKPTALVDRVFPPRFIVHQPDEWISPALHLNSQPVDAQRASTGIGLRRDARLAFRRRPDDSAAGFALASDVDMIPLVPAITRFARVPVPHTNDATYALDAAGNEWVAKREAEMGCEALLAEAITWLLARQIGVRTPDAAFCDEGSERAWLSRRVPDANHWSAAIATRVSNLGEAGAIVALDAIVFNEARHGRNLLATAEGPNSPFTVWAIDADEARIGHVEEFAALVTAVPDPRIHAAGFPASTLLPQALAAAQLAAALPGRTLRAMAESACLVAREPRVEMLLDALTDRCARAEWLTREYALLLEARQ